MQHLKIAAILRLYATIGGKAGERSGETPIKTNKQKHPQDTNCLYTLSTLNFFNALKRLERNSSKC